MGVVAPFSVAIGYASRAMEERLKAILGQVDVLHRCDLGIRNFRFRQCLFRQKP